MGIAEAQGALALGSGAVSLGTSLYQGYKLHKTFGEAGDLVKTQKAQLGESSTLLNAQLEAQKKKLAIGMKRSMRARSANSIFGDQVQQQLPPLNRGLG